MGITDEPLSYKRMNDRARSGSDRSEEARARLLEGALRCVREKGLAGTTSRDIATASGVNLAGITYHFGSKDELLAAALVKAVRSWVDPALEALRSGGDPSQRILTAIQALQASLAGAGDLLGAYLEALVQAPRNPSLRREVDGLFAELRGFLADQITELQALGELPAWIQPEAMAVLLVAAADGIALHAALDPGGVDHHAVSAQALQLLLGARTPGKSS